MFNEQVQKAEKGEPLPIPSPNVSDLVLRINSLENDVICSVKAGYLSTEAGMQAVKDLSVTRLNLINDVFSQLDISKVRSYNQQKK